VRLGASINSREPNTIRPTGREAAVSTRSACAGQRRNSLVNAITDALCRGGNEKKASVARRLVRERTMRTELAVTQSSFPFVREPSYPSRQQEQEEAS
jgi:hypothetical protein